MQVIGGNLKNTTSIQLPTQFYNAFVHKNLDNFTLADCYKAVYGDDGQLYCHNKYGRLRYHINKLVNKGLLIKHWFENDSKPTYIKSDVFSIMIKEKVVEEEQHNINATECQLSKLQEKHAKYESEIQVLLSEWREFNVLLNEYPYLKSVIDKSIACANKDINDTIGKIRAVKKVIDSVAG